MPEFVYDYTKPDRFYLNTAVSGVPESRTDLPNPNQPAPPTTPAPTGLSDAEKKRRAREKAKRQAEKRRAAQAAREEARRNRFNPFTAPFKSPAELRAEAARLAALGSPTEQALRAQQQQEEAGLAGLTGGLSTALRGVSEAQTAGLAGLGSLYQQLGGAAQSAAQSAAAAAGAPTSIAPGTTPTAIASFLPTAAGPGLGAVVRAYESVAPVIGAQLVGASRANLAKALTQRASQISSDTAKYLRQLQQEEIDRAIAQQTSEQNLARLGLQQQEQEFGQQIDLAQLQQGQQRINLSAQRLMNQIDQDLLKPGKDRRKKIQTIKDRILNNVDALKQEGEPSGKYEFTVYYTDDKGLQKVPRTIQAATIDEAKRLAAGDVDQAFQGTIEVEQGDPVFRPLTNQEILSRLTSRLVNAGMSRKAAQAWIYRNVLNSSPSGAFRGGVT